MLPYISKKESYLWSCGESTHMLHIDILYQYVVICKLEIRISPLLPICAVNVIHFIRLVGLN